MKKELFLIGAAAAVYSRARVKTAYAWSADVHRHLALKALELLEKEKKVRPAAFFKDWHTEISEGALQPDKMGDMDKGSGKHYYACMNAKGKELDETKGFYRNRLGNFLPSARTLFRANYTAAVSLYKSGKTAEAMTCLGRAIHFVSDMGCTPHVANMASGIKASNVHNAFEKQINNSYANFTASSFDKRLTKYYEKADPGEAFNKLVKYAGKFVETILHLDPRAFDDTAKNTLPVTEQHVMAVLLKFYNDCTADNGNFLCNDKQYCFKNEGSGLVITVTPRGLAVDELSKDKEQKMLVKLSELGTFGLKVADGGYVNKKCSGYDYLKIDGKAAQFRAEALGNRRFIITTEESGYEKVLAPKGGKLASVAYEPENPAMVWVIN
ncbi:zinc dependent phospholipase C family protein [Ruminococcus sp.]|uniref:zinc dependent phospholipase C family protein n=1 Tax=Ruminococcus sp. TaxID=41978 RepID=UPI0025F657E9|nr:zinc dependent phospholipase C family protein [Ruminococcus sp.]MBQ8967918.1 phospholipase [Ruminococcus sp.]